MIGHYFRDVGGLLGIAADEEYWELHREAEPYVDSDRVGLTLT